MGGCEIKFGGVYIFWWLVFKINIRGCSVGVGSVWLDDVWFGAVGLKKLLFVILEDGSLSIFVVGLWWFLLVL